MHAPHLEQFCSMRKLSSSFCSTHVHRNLVPPWPEYDISTCFNPIGQYVLLTYIHTYMHAEIYICMGALLPGSAHDWPSDHAPINTSGNFLTHFCKVTINFFFIGILFKTRDSACNPVLHWYMINVDPLKKIHICQLFIIIIIETFTMITIDGNTHCCRGHHPSPLPQKCADAAPTGALSC